MNFENWIKQYGNIKIPETTRIDDMLFTNATLLEKKPIYSGKLIAIRAGEYWKPSIDFLQTMAKAAKKYAIVDEKGEWMLTCGKDVFGASVISHNKPGMGEHVVILNKHKEAIGLGKVVAPLEGQKLTIQRLYDIGDLLRREKRPQRI